MIQGSQEFGLMLKSRLLCLILLSQFMSACAMQAIDPAAQTPTCSSQAECDVRMRAAATWMHLHLDNYVKVQTDSLVQTYMDMSPADRILMRVTKVPANDHEYRIETEAYCAMKVGCSDRPWDVVQRINRFMNGAWKVVDLPDHADRSAGSRH